MSRADYGRAFKIRSRDVSSYDRTKRYQKNPMGVTTLAQVNGRGAYSARNAAKGKSKSQRIAAARKLLNQNSGGKKVQKRGRRASFVSNATPAAKRRGKRLAAYNAAKKRGYSANKAARSALRKVPWTSGERSSGSSFQGMTANKRRKSKSMTPNAIKRRKAPKRKKIRSSSTAAAPARKTRKRKTAAKDPKRVAAGRKAARTRKGNKKVATKAKAKRKTTKRRKATGQYKQVKATKRVRVKYGKYKRVRMKNPRTGKMQYSYMYRTKSGSLRRIPTSAIVGKKVKGTKELPAKVRKSRARAARRIIKSGGAFVPNASRARRRAAEKGRLVRKGMSKAKAARAALRKHPFTASEKSKGKRMLKSGKIVTRKSAAGKRKVSRKGTRKVSRKGKKRKTTRKAKSRKGVSRKRSLAAKRGWAKRRRSGTAPKRRKSTKRSGAKRGTSRRKMSKSKRSAAAKKAWRTRKRRYGKKGYRKNADLFASLLGTAALVGVGFLLHRGLTAGVLMLLTGDQNGGEETVPEGTSGLGRYRRRRAMRGFGQANGNGNGMTKPLVGAGVALVGSVGAVYVGGESGPAIAAGMIASVLGQGLVAVLKATGQVELAAALGGYSNSMAFNLRGVGRMGRRRAMRGFGATRSIMPRYSPVGAFQQAAAGTHNPNRSMGEYFTPNAVGEYFAPTNLQGVGAYEPAGQLAMQASAGLGQQPIDDGIRPDTNLDRVLDLAEAAAGLRGVGQAQFAQAAAGMPGGIGAYVTAERQNGAFQEQRVPTSSQWIPNGPLWAGTLGVTGDNQTSDIPAGILAGPGGNGILSGG